MKKNFDDKNILRAVFSEERIVIGKPVMIARESDFKHRRGITKKDLTLMKENFDKKVVGLDIYFDYSHGEDTAKGDKAAGWIKSLEFGETETDGVKRAALFAVPEWTQTAAQEIADREYQYVSPEIFWEWTHPESGQKFNSVLRSVAILNRPQIPGQPSIKLSETEITEKKEDLTVKKLKEFAEKELGAKFGAEEVTEEQIVSAFSDKLKTAADDMAKKDDEIKKLNDKYSALEATKSADEKELVKFKEQVDRIEAERFAEKVDSLIEKAITKLPPAQAQGWFKELAKKDLALAEKTFAELPDMTGAVNVGTKVIDAGKSDDADAQKDKEITKLREEMAKGRGVKFSEISYREAADEYFAQKKEAK